MDNRQLLEAIRHPPPDSPVLLPIALQVLGLLGKSGDGGPEAHHMAGWHGDQ